jgi:uncharacterized protein YgfB (UPF0149 family)
LKYKLRKGADMGGYSVNHRQLQRLASDAGLRQSSAELHGRMLGIMCVEQGRSHGIVDRLLCDESQRIRGTIALREAAERLYRETWEALDGAGLGFTLLLPQDAGHAERCRALIDWAGGFLRGLALAGVDGRHDLELNGRHALADIAKVARCDPAGISGGDEEFEEACEFVWIAAVLVRELLNDPENHH